MRRSAFLFVGLLAAVTTLAPRTESKPQANASLSLGIAGRGDDAPTDGVVFAGGLRGDVLLGRQGPHDFGVGPYLTVDTAAFDDVRPGAGLAVLVPIHDTFPIVVSGGPFIRLGDGAALGASLRAFFGSRSFNFHGAYDLAGGLVLGLDRTFYSTPETVASLTVQVDALLVALPFVLGYQALFGGSGD
jgi:hypothetical protein